MDETADGARETLQEFIETLQNAAASSGLVTSLVHNLTQAVSKVYHDHDDDIIIIYIEHLTMTVFSLLCSESFQYGVHVIAEETTVVQSVQISLK